MSSDVLRWASSPTPVINRDEWAGRRTADVTRALHEREGREARCRPWRSRLEACFNQLGEQDLLSTEKWLILRRRTVALTRLEGAP